MAIGTAGYTAMLAVLALEDHGIKPAAGPVVVTGAAGGVGSVATAILSKLGYLVSSTAPDCFERLKRLPSRFWSFVEVAPSMIARQC